MTHRTMCSRYRVGWASGGQDRRPADRIEGATMTGLTWSRRAVPVVVPALSAALAALAALAAVVVTAPGAAAATSYWKIHNRPAAGPSLCITAGPVDAPATTGACTGAADQDWAFVNGAGGEYLVSRARPGHVLAVSSLSVGAYLILKKLDASDRAQVFVAGDPVPREHGHLRPQDARDLCLQMLPPRVNRSVVVLARCGSAGIGEQTWQSTFTGNH